MNKKPHLYFSMKMNYLTCLVISVTFKVKHLPREEYGNVLPESACLKDTIGGQSLPTKNKVKQFTPSSDVWRCLYQMFLLEETGYMFCVLVSVGY